MKIAYVIGAGVCKEVDFPLGKELKERISDSLRWRFKYGTTLENGNHRTWGIIKDIADRQAEGDHGNLTKLYDSISKAARHISNNLVWADSIENFLHQQKQHESYDWKDSLGKLAICEEIEI